MLAPKLAYEERQLTNLVQGSGGSPSAKERREIEAQEAFVEELRVLLEEVKRVAPLWKPTLDDGIVLVMAPLWRLVPHKSWQRELKKKWARARRRQVRLGAARDAPLAGARRPEVRAKTAASRSHTASRTSSGFRTQPTRTSGIPAAEPTIPIDQLAHADDDHLLRGARRRTQRFAVLLGEPALVMGERGADADVSECRHGREHFG